MKSYFLKWFDMLPIHYIFLISLDLFAEAENDLYLEYKALTNFQLPGDLI